MKLRDIAFWAGLAGAWLLLGWQYYVWVLSSGGEILTFEAYGRTVEILQPYYFAVWLLAPLVVLLQRNTLSDLPVYQRVVNTAFRITAIVAVGVALVQPVVTSFESRVSTVFVVDTSSSIPDSVLVEAQAWINEAIKARNEKDNVQVLGVASRAYAIELGDDGVLGAIPRPPGEEGLVSDLSGAIRMAYGVFPQDHVKHLVFVSDGNETRGDLLAEVHRAKSFGIKVFNREITFEAPKEVLIRALEFPDDLKVGEPFTLIARVFSNHAVSAELQLWQNDFKDGTQRVDLQPGITEVPFKTQVYEAGLRRFKVDMKVLGADQTSQNNTYVHNVTVSGKPRVLYIEGELRSRLYLERALRNENFDLETRGPMGVPTTLEEFAPFDLVILSDVAALHVTQNQMQLIDRYTRELGGGFIMVGGESSFGPGGYYGSYIERVLPVGFEPEKKRNTPSLGLLLLIDKSGSMTGDRMELAKEAAKATVEILQPDDRVGVGGFDDGVMPVVTMQSASNRVRIASDIARLRPSGGTNIAKALEYGFEQLTMVNARRKHIILLTDGHADTSNIFTELMPALRMENITVSTVAVGSGSDTTMLRRIAEGGGGRYYYTNDPYSVPRIFMKETSMVSRSSMVEEPFRPKIAKRAQVLEGIAWESAPYLLGYVSTKAKPQAEVLMISDYGEPILARWRNGLGKVVAFTSDLKNRWAVEWVRWPGYAKFWSQLIRDTMRANNEDTLAMTTEIIQDEARIVVDAIGEDDKYINDLKSTVTVQNPDGSTSQIALNQTAAGRYEARLKLSTYGSYGLKAVHEKDGATTAVSLATVSYPYPREFQFVEANHPLMRRVAEIGGGETDPDAKRLFDPMGEEAKYRRELWPLFIVLALVLAVLDLAFRRIRLSGRTELSWERVIS